MDNKGKRKALPNAEIMMHQPAIDGNGVQGQATAPFQFSGQLYKRLSCSFFG